MDKAQKIEKKPPKPDSSELKQISASEASLPARVIDIRTPPPQVPLSDNALLVAAQKKLAEILAKTETLNQEFDDKSALCTQVRRELDMLTVEAQHAEQKQRELDFQLQKGRATLEQLSVQIANQIARQETLTKTLELYEQQVLEKKEQSHQQIARLSDELFEDLEKIHSLKRQVKESGRAEIEKERDALRSEIEAFKAEAWSKTQVEMERHDEEMKKKRSEIEESLRRYADEAKEKANSVLKQAEEVASLLRHNAEEKSRFLVEQAQEKLFHTQKEAERELADARRQIDEAEYAFLQEKNQTLTRLKALEKDSRQEADRILSSAQGKAEEELRKADLKAAEIIEHANKKASDIIKDADRLASEIIEREKNALEVQKKMHSESLERARATANDLARDALDKAKIEAQKMVLTASEQAKAIAQASAEQYKMNKEESLELLRQKTREAEHQVGEMLGRAAIEAQTIVEKAKARAFNIDSVTEEILKGAQRQADKFIDEANKHLTEINQGIKSTSERLSALQAEDSRLEFAIKERRKIETQKENQLRRFEQESLGMIARERKKTLIFALVLGIITGILGGILTSQVTKAPRKSRAHLENSNHVSQLASQFKPIKRPFF